MLQIREVQQAPPGLLRLIGPLEGPHQVHEPLDRRAALRQGGKLLPAVPVEPVGQLSKALLHSVPQVLHPLSGLQGPGLLHGAEFHGPLPLPAHRREWDGQAGERPVPAAPLGGGAEGLHPLQGGLEGGSVVPLQQLVGGRQGQGLLQPLGAVPPLPGGVGEEQAAPGGLPGIRHPGQLPHLPLLPQPALRVGVALDAAEHVQHDLGQAAVVPPGGQGVHQDGKGAVRLDSLVLLLQHVLQHLGHEHLCLPLVAQPEVRVQVQPVALLPQEGGAEGVDGGDLGPVHQGGLPPQVPVPWVLRQAGGELLGDAGAQLGGGGLGVGDDQEAVQVQPLPGHPVQQPLHQHPGLARPGSGGHQQFPAPVVYDLLLFIGQRKSHGGSSCQVSIGLGLV